VVGYEYLVVPKSTDIVQGLPKVTRLFEASGPEGSRKIEQLMQQFEEEYSNLEAALLVRKKVAKEHAEEIQSVYLDQGVNVNIKHIEMVVGQMTRKFKVLDSGDTALKRGSLVTVGDIEAVQATGWFQNDIKVLPLIRGVSLCGKDSHVLVSMSFREMKNVLIQDLVKGPTSHEVNGVKENIILGQKARLGSNWSPRTRQTDKVLKDRADDLSERSSPERCGWASLDDIDSRMRDM